MLCFATVFYPVGEANNHSKSKIHYPQHDMNRHTNIVQKSVDTLPQSGICPVGENTALFLSQRSYRGLVSNTMLR